MENENLNFIKANKSGNVVTNCFVFPAHDFKRCFDLVAPAIASKGCSRPSLEKILVTVSSDTVTFFGCNGYSASRCSMKCSNTVDAPVSFLAKYFKLPKFGLGSAVEISLMKTDAGDGFAVMSYVDSVNRAQITYKFDLIDVESFPVASLDKQFDKETEPVVAIGLNGPLVSRIMSSYNDRVVKVEIYSTTDSIRLTSSEDETLQSIILPARLI